MTEMHDNWQFFKYSAFFAGKTTLFSSSLLHCCNQGPFFKGQNRDDWYGRSFLLIVKNQIEHEGYIKKPYEWSCCQMQNQWWIWIHFDHRNIPNRNNTNHPSWLDSKPLTRETIRNHFLDPKMKSLNIIITKTDSYCFLKKSTAWPHKRSFRKLIRDFRCWAPSRGKLTCIFTYYSVG